MDKLKIEDTVFAQAFVKHLDGLKEIFKIEGNNFQPIRGDIKDIQIDRLSVDFVYEVDEEKLIHFEFQSTNKSSDIYRFQLYDAHLVSQYMKPIETYVIYTNSILTTCSELELGSVRYKFTPIYMGNYCADIILSDIRNKLINGSELTLTDIAWLEFTPLMDSKVSKQDVIETALELTTNIDDEDRRIQCQTILVALALKFEVEISNELGRRIRMSPLGQKIFNEGIEEGIEKGREKGQLEKQREIAKNLMDILNDEMIAKKCGLTIDEVKKLRSEIEKDNN